MSLPDPVEAPGRIRALDGVRGVAIALVLLAHGATFAPGSDTSASHLRTVLSCGWIGVDLFFVLSGFLITGVLLGTKGHAHYFRNFYMRRVLRIFPLYYVSLLVFFCLTVLLSNAKNSQGLSLPPGVQEARESLPYYWFYIQNWVTFFTGSITQYIGHFWSLAVEEQFYLIWPMLVWRLSRRSLAALCIGAVLIGIPFRYILAAHGYNGVSLYTFTLTRLDGLMLGALVAIIDTGWPRVRGGCWWGVSAMFLGLLFLIPIGLLDRGLSYKSSLMPIFGFPALAIFFTGILLLGLDPTTSWVFENALLRRFGKYSYAIYIMHVPIMIGVHYGIVHLGAGGTLVGHIPGFTIVTCAIAFSCGAVSWRYVESPFLRLKKNYACDKEPDSRFGCESSEGTVPAGSVDVGAAPRSVPRWLEPEQ